MADGQGATPPPDPQAPDPRALARDWITIWQSELAALATDREMQDSWVRWVTLWAQAAHATARLLPGTAPPHEPAAGRAGPAAAVGTAAPMAAPDARDATIERLADRVAELERRLAGFLPPPATGDHEPGA